MAEVGISKRGLNDNDANVLLQICNYGLTQTITVDFCNRMRFMVRDCG